MEFTIDQEEIYYVAELLINDELIPPCSDPDKLVTESELKNIFDYIVMKIDKGKLIEEAIIEICKGRLE